MDVVAANIAKKVIRHKKKGFFSVFQAFVRQVRQHSSLFTLHSSLFTLNCASLDALARQELADGSDAEPPVGRATVAAQILVCTAADEMPVEEVVASVEGDTQMTSCGATVVEQATEDEALHALVFIARAQRQRTRAEEDGNAPRWREPHPRHHGGFILADCCPHLSTIAYH